MRQNQCIIYAIVAFVLWLILVNLYLSYLPSGRWPRDRLADELQGLEKAIVAHRVKGDQILLEAGNIVHHQKHQQQNATSKEKAPVSGKPPALGPQSSEAAAPQTAAQSTTSPLPPIERNQDAIAMLLFSCNRISVRRSLDQLIRYRPSKRRFPIIVSQDCRHEPTTHVIQSYGDKVHLIQQPDQSDIPVPPKEKKFKGYFRIARHYKWALGVAFGSYNFSAVAIIEDDLDVSPDIYEYFAATLPVLQADDSLWCVSAWNDNGKPELVDRKATDLLYRTDFFPGLGWMLTRDLWQELAPKWPPSYWDDWMREPQQRRGRSCIRPELSRTRTFGKIGVSNGLFFDKHLKYIYLNDKFVEFTRRNLSYLRKEPYDASFLSIVYESPIVGYQELRRGQVSASGSVRVVYDGKAALKKIAKLLGLMDDFKSGVPRTAYQGVISFVFGQRRVFLTPSTPFTEYAPD